ncbi:MAG: pantetheine-phosphate adenylyltransferase [Planctomycetota bacterium]
MRKAIYPGTFDPPHLGHLDLIARGLNLVDELVVAVAVNREKQSLFTQDERVGLLETCTHGLKGVRVVAFTGLVVELLKREGASFMLRGIRTFSDFEAELGMALTNRQLARGYNAETLFVLPTLEYSHYSSRRVKEVAGFGGAVGEFLPAPIREAVEARLKLQRR